MLPDLVVLFPVIAGVSLLLICIEVKFRRQQQQRDLIREERRLTLWKMYGKKGDYSFRSGPQNQLGTLHNRKCTIRQRRNCIPGGDIEPASSI